MGFLPNSPLLSPDVALSPVEESLGVLLPPTSTLPPTDMSGIVGLTVTSGLDPPLLPPTSTLPPIDTSGRLGLTDTLDPPLLPPTSTLPPIDTSGRLGLTDTLEPPLLPPVERLPLTVVEYVSADIVFIVQS